MKDGIEGIEYEVIENVIYIAVLSRTVASSHRLHGLVSRWR